MLEEKPKKEGILTKFKQGTIGAYLLLWKSPLRWFFLLVRVKTVSGGTEKRT